MRDELMTERKALQDSQSQQLEVCSAIPSGRYLFAIFLFHLCTSVYLCYNTAQCVALKRNSSDIVKHALIILPAMTDFNN